MKTPAIVLTCEHGGARVPRRYRVLFEDGAGRRALASHRGSDLGALSLARILQRALHVPLHASTTTRLLVDLNRSVGHPRLFSEFTKRLDFAERQRLLDRHYFPHRRAVESWIDAKVRRDRQVLHVAVHSFVPRFEGRTRTTDIGLLYDPSRTRERAFCRRWKRALEALDDELRVRRNYPYLGKSDGLVTQLRKSFGASCYIGVELECNQALLGTPRRNRRIATSITQSLRAIVPNPC